MILHTEEPFFDSSGYTPSFDKIAELKRKLRICHSQCLSEASWVESDLQPPNRQDRVCAGEHPVLQLSLHDLREIEEAYSFFECKSIGMVLSIETDACPVSGLPLNKLQADSFPLPTLSGKISHHRTLLPTTQPAFIIRGLKPEWFGKYKNAVIFTGIASHVGTKRALAPGDPNVLRTPPSHVFQDEH